MLFATVSRDALVVWLWDFGDDDPAVVYEEFGNMFETVLLTEFLQRGHNE